MFVKNLRYVYSILNIKYKKMIPNRINYALFFNWNIFTKIKVVEIGIWIFEFSKV